MVNRTQLSEPLSGEKQALRLTAAVVLALFSGLCPAFAVSQATAADAAEVAVDPDAKAALVRMGAYLRTLPAYQTTVTSTREEVLDNGLKIQSEWLTELVVRKPDRMLAHTTSDSQDRRFFYDGKQFTLWATRADLYATVPAPPTIAELVRMLEAKYDIEVPLVDLFRWGTEEDSSAGITAAIDLGPGTVDGTTCHHYAFRQEGLDWQVWIQEGDYPLPRKLVLTTTTDEARPQFVATYSWNLAPSMNDAAFTFVPPADVHRIEFATNAPEAGEKK